MLRRFSKLPPYLHVVDVCHLIGDKEGGRGRTYMSIYKTIYNKIYKRVYKAIWSELMREGGGIYRTYKKAH